MTNPPAKAEYLTPEERAIKIAVICMEGLPDITVNNICGYIAAAIREAVEVERERLAIETNRLIGLSIKSERNACAKEMADAGEFELADQLLARK